MAMEDSKLISKLKFHLDSRCQVCTGIESLPGIRYADGSILFEDSRLQGANRITSMEIDPVPRPLHWSVKPKP